MGRLQYISSTNGAFDSVLADNITATSVIESKFLITSFYNGRPVYFGVNYADTFVRASEKDMQMYILPLVDASAYLTLNEEHTAYFSSKEYRWNGTKIADVTGTVAIPSSPRFRSKIKGNLYYFKITDNGVDRVNLVAWDENGVLGMKDLVSGNFYAPSSGTWTAGPPYVPPTPSIQVPINKYKLGADNIQKTYEGSTKINKMYVGNDLVYRALPTTITPTTQTYGGNSMSGGNI